MMIIINYFKFKPCETNKFNNTEFNFTPSYYTVVFKDIIKEYIQFIYKLDMLRNCDEFTINQESMEEITRHLLDIKNKITTLKSNMKNSMNIINEISTDYIERILLKNPIKNMSVVCTICSKEFNSKGNLSKHMVFCTKKNGDKININNIYIDNGLVKL